MSKVSILAPPKKKNKKTKKTTTVIFLSNVIANAMTFVKRKISDIARAMFLRFAMLISQVYNSDDRKSGLYGNRPMVY